MKKKGRFLKKYRGNTCLNCGVPLDILDRYCHNCGQINSIKKLSLKDFFGEFFSSLFSYDSRLMHTMRALLFSPGKISKEYIEGKRVKYANPFRFYLSISIIFFIINGLFIDFDRLSYQIEKSNTPSNSKDKTLKKETDSRKPIINYFIETEKNDSIIHYSEAQLDTMSTLNAFNKRLRIYTRHYAKTNERSPEIALNSLNHNNNWYNKYIYKRSLKTTKLNSNPIELLRFVFSKLPFIIFFFLPFFTFAIWIFYIKNSFTYMEHLVFTFHTQTMFFILLGIALLIGAFLENSTPINIASLLFLIYLYKAMRKFYNQRRGKTIVKFLSVNILFFILASIGSLITIIGAAFIF